MATASSPQIPALIISLAAGLLVAKGGTRGSADKAVLDQLSGYPNALFVAALLMAVLGVVPGLPFLPFVLLGGLMASVGFAIPRRLAREAAEAAARQAANEAQAKAEARASIKEQLKSFEIELVLSGMASARMPKAGSRTSSPGTLGRGPSPKMMSHSLTLSSWVAAVVPWILIW